MKTLVFVGSARKNGHTAKMAEILISHLEGEIDIIDAYRIKRVSPCIDCRHCWKVKECVIKDGMQAVYDKIEWADCIVFAAPMYFHCVPGPLKLLLDRMQVYWAGHGPRGDAPKEIIRKGAILMAGGAPAFENQFTAGEIVLNGVLGDLNAKCLGTVLFPNSDHDSLEKRADIREQIVSLANNINAYHIKNDQKAGAI